MLTGWFLGGGFWAHRKERGGMRGGYSSPDYKMRGCRFSVYLRTRVLVFRWHPVTPSHPSPASLCDLTGRQQYAISMIKSLA